MMNKKGQAIFVKIMIFIIALIAIVQFVQPVKNEVITARNPTNLDCTNSSISTGQKMGCVIVDVTLPYFIGIAIAVAGGFMAIKSF